MPEVSSNLCGILVIDKPVGITSMDAVAMVRRMAGGVKTGHAGTLDPLATGVLVMAIGAATKSIDQLMNTTKQYDTTIDFSAFTSTDDLEGIRTNVPVSSPPDESTIQSALQRFHGRTSQRPPVFSAKKINGTRAYALARRGKTVEIPENDVVVHSIELIRYQWPLVEVRLHCDKGFYVRSLARDLGAALGTGGHCVAIRRTAVGPFTIDMAKAIVQLPSRLTPDDLVSLDRARAMINSPLTPLPEARVAQFD